MSDEPTITDFIKWMTEELDGNEPVPDDFWPLVRDFWTRWQEDH